jgi:hypothetical protein
MTYISPEEREDIYIDPQNLKVFAYQNNVLLYTPMDYDTGQFSEDVSEYVPVDFDQLSEDELYWANQSIAYFQSL